MGRVKINFEALYFLHGTPTRRSIGSAASHGCIRMLNEDAIELARLVHRFGTPALTPDEVEQLATSATTHLIQLESPVPIEVRYDLAEVRNGQVTVYRDVYGLATRTLRDEVYVALAEHGIDTARVDSSRVRSLVRRVAPKGNSVPIESIMVNSLSQSRAFPY
jgi:murein L,D-transpeptidase YcbB/YkuD